MRSVTRTEEPMLATLALPHSAFELRDAVRHARRFDPVRLDRVLRLDSDRRLLEVQASATWASAAARLRAGCEEAGEAWEGLGTIGAALATNAAGPDGRPVVAHVESLALVTPDGELRRVSRECHPELFRLAIGGHDAFGALYSATLKLDSLARAEKGRQAVEKLDLPAAGGPQRAIELLVPPGVLPEFLAEARERCEAWRMPIEGAEVRRTLPENETALPWARREYAAVRLALAERRTMGGSVRATQLARELIALAIEQGGSFPLASTPEATREQVEACYPELRTVLAEKRRLDPAEKLASAWYRHYRSLLGREACRSRWNVER